MTVMSAVASEMGTWSRLEMARRRRVCIAERAAIDANHARRLETSRIFVQLRSASDHAVWYASSASWTFAVIANVNPYISDPYRATASSTSSLPGGGVSMSPMVVMSTPFRGSAAVNGLHHLPSHPSLTLRRTLPSPATTQRPVVPGTMR